MPLTDALLARFLSTIDRSGECWTWTGPRAKNGYGKFFVSSRPIVTALSHRLAYEQWNGVIPAERDIDHVCRNRACVNPAHLEAVDRLTNIRRGAVCLASPHWKPWSDEHRHALGSALRGQKRSAETRARMSAAKAGKPGPIRTPETRAKIAAAKRLYWARKREEAA